MKNYLIICFSLLLITSCSNRITTTAEDMCLQGKVKEIVESQYKAVEKFGAVEQGDPYRDDDDYDLRYEFDEKGNCTKMYRYSIYGESEGSISYVYDAKGRKVGQKNYDSGDNFIGELAFIYGKDGKLTKVQKYLEESNPAGCTVYEYKDGVRTAKGYDFKGNLLQTETQTYSKHDFPLETKIFDNEGKLASWRVEKYSADGLRKQLIGYEEDGSEVFNISFTYDKYGNLLTQTGDDVLEQSYEYTYDEKGNWVRSIVREDGKPVCVVTRAIEYWEKNK